MRTQSKNWNGTDYTEIILPLSDSASRRGDFLYFAFVYVTDFYVANGFINGTRMYINHLNRVQATSISITALPLLKMLELLLRKSDDHGLVAIEITVETLFTDEEVNALCAIGFYQDTENLSLWVMTTN